MEDQSKLIKQMEEEGMEESSGGDFGYKDCVLEIDEVELDVTGSSTNHDYMKSWEPVGQAMIIIYFKVIEGDHKGLKFNITVPLYTQTNKLRMFPGFTGDDGKYIPASELGEIIHKIKEYDAKQWSKDPFTSAKLLKCKFEIGVRGSESDKGAWAFAAFERQLLKDKKYQEDQKQGEEKLLKDAKENVGKSNEIPMKTPVKEEEEEKEEKIDPDDLPF